MATIDPNIAMGYRPVQIENPLNQLAALTQIQTGQQGQQLNALKMQEAQLELEDRNALRGLDISSPDFISNVSKRNPKLALALQKEMTLNKEAGLKNVGLETKNLTDRYKQEKDIFQYISTPEQFLARSISNLNDPLLGPQLKNAGVTEATIRQKLDAAIKQPGGFEQLLNQNIIGLDKFIESQITANAPTTAMKEFEYGQTNPAFAARQIDLKRASAPSSQVYMPPSEKAEQIGRGQSLVKNYEEVSNSARLAAKTLPAIDTNLSLLNQGFKTGFTAETQKSAASILSALGLPEATRYATNAQVFKANLNDLVLQKQLEQKGVQTAADADRITSTGAQLGNTVQANEFLLNVAKAQQKQAIEKRNFYDKWYQQNKTYDGAENAWFNGQGGASIFDRPELKKYNVGAAKPSANTSNLPAGVGADWVLKTDAKGNRAYVSPDNSKFVEVK
jgi:hypothetical protein